MISPNRKIELAGLDYVRSLVNRMECSFQEFSHHNDQGNDCYIEFVENLIPSNYGVFVQIKSGDSFKDGSGYKIPADKRHIAYWAKSLYKAIGIVHDAGESKAFWVDLSLYIKSNPQILQQETHNIRVCKDNELNDSTFNQFVEYCTQYKAELQAYDNLGRSLELFADVGNPENCFEGFKALYSIHRDKEVSLFYLISNFSRIRDEKIRRHILGILSNYFNRDIFWHANNIKHFPSEESVATTKRILSDCFGITEIKCMVPYMQEGVVRGSFSYLVYLILSSIRDSHLILKDICFNLNEEIDFRNFCFWLYLHLAKFKSVEETIMNADKYLNQFPDARNDDAIVAVLESIKAGDLFPVG
jgi:hypothetical protein